MAELRRGLRWLIALICHYGGLDRLYRRWRGAALTILMFHRVRDEPDPYPLSISRSSYTKIVHWLRRADLLVGLEAGLTGLDARESGTHYVLTFDDGYRDNMALLETPGGVPEGVVYLATAHVGGSPIWAYRLARAVAARNADKLDLDDLGLGGWALNNEKSAIRFLNDIGAPLKRLPAHTLENSVDIICERLRPSPSAADEPREMLDWRDARQLHEAGVEIGAHTVHHTILSPVDDDTARMEIERSRDAVAENIAPPKHFAYPNGSADDFGDRDVALVREAGFSTAVTTTEGVNRPDADPYRLRRHNVDELRFHSSLGFFSRAMFFSETSGILDWLRSRRMRRMA